MSIFLSFGEGFSEWKIFLFFIFASPLYVFSRSMEDVKKSRKGSSYQEFFTFCYLNKYCGTQIRHQSIFSNFSCIFLNPNIFFSNLNSNCSNLIAMKNLQEQVEKPFCYVPKIVLTFHCLNRLFRLSHNFCKFSAFSL